MPSARRPPRPPAVVAKARRGRAFEVIEDAPLDRSGAVFTGGHERGQFGKRFTGPGGWAETVRHRHHDLVREAVGEPSERGGDVGVGRADAGVVVDRGRRAVERRVPGAAQE